MTEATHVSEYQGLCTICGHLGTFRRGPERSPREGYACPGCRFTLRWRDQAAIIVDEFGRGQSLCIEHLVSRRFLDDVAIYEPALRGPFVTRLNRLPRYTRSYFRPDQPLGKISSDGLRNEDIARLTFADESFDLVITSDVMEHVPDVEAAFAETLRVLRPGGIHVFTIPNDYPLPDRTVARARIEDGREVHLLPPRYHNAGDGTPCLVFTDFGADLVDMIRDLGGHLSIVRRSVAIAGGHVNATFVIRKPFASRPAVSSIGGWDTGAQPHSGAL